MRAQLMTLTVLLCAPLAACGAGDSDGAGDGPPPAASSATASFDPTAPVTGISTDLETGLARVKDALDAERVEADGDTVHVYLADGPTSLAESSWCDVAAINLPPDYDVVTHWEGKQTDC